MKRSFEELVSIMHRLRAPGGCPWDREQTWASLKPFIIEEAYEVVDAIDHDDRAALVEEIGDLLLQTVFLAELGSEEGSFDIYDAVTAIHDKLVRRHPHVFGDVKAETAEQVLTNWEQLKKAERRDKKQGGVLSGVPQSLPGLLKASRLTEKAARVGFDWENVDDIFKKIDEEVSELHEAVAANDKKHMEEEVGDLLFTLANIARRLDINPEEAIQGTNRKFQQRFEFVEERLHAENRSFEATSLEQLDALWNEAKKA